MCVPGSLNQLISYTKQKKKPKLKIKLFDIIKCAGGIEIIFAKTVQYRWYLNYKFQH